MSADQLARLVEEVRLEGVEGGEGVKRRVGEPKSTQVPNYNYMRVLPPQVADPTTAYPERVRKSVVDSMDECIGETPLLRLHKIEAENGLECELYAKLEFFNAGGSVKDRIARRMIERAEADGTLKPGDIIIEATSGNTGIGLALVCACKGYKLIITMPEKMSVEKENTLVALGAHVVRTPSSANWDDPDSHIGIAYKLKDAINASPHIAATAHCLDQYKNAGNVEAHYCETAREILDQMDHRIDYFVATVGTGGTFTGTASRLKAELPSVKCIAVDPIGSFLSSPIEHLHDEAKLQKLQENLAPYEVEGIGYDFHPPTWSQKLADGFEIVDDKETFYYARKLVSSQGMLCGGSAGCALAGAVHVAKKAPKGSRIVFMVPDSTRNYVSKFLSNDWMLTHHLFNRPADHPKYLPDPLAGRVSKLPSLTVIPKVMANDPIPAVYKELEAASHVAVLDPQQGTMLSIVSKPTVQEALLLGNDQTIATLCFPFTMTFFSEQDTDYNGLRMHLAAQYQESKIKEPAVIVVPEGYSTESEPLSDFKKRLVKLDWRDREVRIVTSQSFLGELRH